MEMFGVKITFGVFLVRMNLLMTQNFSVSIDPVTVKMHTKKVMRMEWKKEKRMAMIEVMKMVLKKYGKLC